jgi:hypothetical protein
MRRMMEEWRRRRRRMTMVWLRGRHPDSWLA